MPRGSDPQRENEYKELVKEFHHDRRYPGREEEVAARIVNKQRAQHGETIGEQEAKRRGESPDRDLQIHDYDRLDVDEIAGRLDALSEADIKKIEAYERAHNNRKTLIEQLERHLS